MTVELGQEAPDFELKDQAGDLVSLASSAATRRWRWSSTRSPSPVSARASCASSATTSRRSRTPACRSLAVSCDTPFAQKKWAEEQGFTFPVLSDFWPHGAVAKAYGVFNDALGCANRATFVIDKDGKVVDTFAHRQPRHPPGEEPLRRGHRQALSPASAAAGAAQVAEDEQPRRHRTDR